MRLEYCSYHEIEIYLQQKDSVIIPIGSTEQHSPDGLLGTDYLIAQKLAHALGQRKDLAVAPVIAVGIAIHHMGFAGTITLKPSTLIAYIKDYVSSLYEHGFRQFFFINGHGGNIPTVTAACAEISQEKRTKNDIVNWWRLPEVQEKEKELFGAENGQHATVSELSVTRFLFPEAFQDKNGFAKEFVKNDYDLTMPKFSWPMSPQGFRELFPFGNMGSNPVLANAEHGKVLFNLALDTICTLWEEFSQKQY